MEKEKSEIDKTRARSRATRGKQILWSMPQLIKTEKAAILVVLSLVLSFILTPSFSTNPPSFEVGDIADRNIKAIRDFKIIDEQATARKRDEAVQNAPLIFVLDDNVHKQVIQRLETAFASMRESLRTPDKPLMSDGLVANNDRINTIAEEDTLSRDLPEILQQLMHRRRAFAQPLGIQVPEEVLSDLLDRGFGIETQEKVVQLIRPVFERGIIPNHHSQLEGNNKGNIVIVGSTADQVDSTPLRHSYLDIEEARKLVITQAFEMGVDTKEVRALAFLASQLLMPNLVFALDETERRREATFASVKPVRIHVQKNEMLVREGQKITQEDVLKLKTNSEGRAHRRLLLVFVTMFVFCMVCTWVVMQVSKEHLPSFRMDVKDLLFLAILLAFLLVVARSGLWMADVVGDNTPTVSGKCLIYAVPLTAGAMLVSIFFGVTESLIFSLLATTFAGILFGRDFVVFFYFLIGSLVAAHGVTPCRNRLIPIRAGLLVGCTNVVLIVLSALLQDQAVFFRMVMSAFLGLCGGVFAGVLVIGLIPLVEMAFAYTTDTKLLELATMDQPMLQELMVQAPGTYHHSIIVGNMVEAAAKSIGANALLAKVAAYYHDIGKTKKPLYFIENQFECENRHEKLAPSMSSLILISHVKDGIELARQHRLGRRITDIISQHHGKSFISFFYNKAVEAREKAQNAKGSELPPINIDDYRYPGPKPQTKEAGLVMLADVVEAACRSLTDPTPARIQGMVNRLINNIFTDGQLDECELTLKDLHSIAKHFNQILATVHHKRIEYPGTTSSSVETKGKMDAADPNNRESKSDRDRPCSNRESSRKDLKRLGIH
jgi:cyclic-di-AMP phosphodiesterase PgpH